MAFSLKRFKYRNVIYLALKRLKYKSYVYGV